MQNLNIDAELQMQLEKHTVLENLSISLFRKSRDNNTNTNGHRLIQICRNNNIFILNGRVHKDRNLGNFTFRNKSVFDYVLSTAESFQYVINFEISETDFLFSDGHSAVTWALRCNPLPTSVIASSLSSDSTPSLQHYGKLKYKWGNNLKEEFANNLCLNEMNEIYLIFDSTEVDVKDKIDSITHKIKYIFQEAAKNTLPRKRNVVVFFFFFFSFLLTIKTITSHGSAQTVSKPEKYTMKPKLLTTKIKMTSTNAVYEMQARTTDATWISISKEKTTKTQKDFEI